MLPNVIEHRCLQPAEAEVQRIPFHLCRPEFHGCRRVISNRRQPVENRSPGIPKPKKLRYLVVRFACRVVPRLADLAITQTRARILHIRIFRLHLIQNRVPARNNQARRRQFRRPPRPVRLQKNRVNVSLKMIHGHERLPQCLRQRFSVRYSHQQRPHQPGPLRHTNRIHIAKLHPCLRKRFAHHRNDLPQMFARRQLRHHPAILSMNVDL